MVNVLIADDSPAIRAFIRSVLEGAPEPYNVDEASSGFEAMRMWPRASYDLVIADINMPDINGLELVRFLRSKGRPELAVLVVSTLSSDRDRTRALAIGADGFLEKPFTPEALLAHADGCLRARRR